MDIRITPAPLCGTIAAIPSKSDVHRLLICAALADKPTKILCPAISEDITATAGCLAALGAKIEYHSGTFTVLPIEKAPESPVLDCGESGSTLRFLLPVAAALCKSVSFTGRGRLPERPISEFMRALSDNGISFSSERLPFTTEGLLQGGDFTLPGNVSSQYITGLLLALPKSKNGGAIRLATPLESASYVNVTLSALSRFGVTVERDSEGWVIPGSQSFSSPAIIEAEGDWSNAAFFLVAGARVTGLRPDSPQGDRAILSQIEAIKGHGEALISLADTPDSLPALAVLAANTEGKAAFTEASRLRIKESDRLKTVHDMIISLGGKADETPDGLIVYGTGLTGGTVNSSGDHRIAMAAAIAGAYARGETTIIGAEAVNKSYPGFWEDFRKLGGIANVI